MIPMEEMLYQKVRRVMSDWDEEDIYAVSFFVYSNEMFSYREYDNVSSFAISYNTEDDCDGASPYSEERWNYAFWRQDETVIIEPAEDSPEMAMLFDWYRENGIENIGQETSFDLDGPVGFPELVDLVAKVARRLQEEGFLKEKFGRPIPIIVHDLDYTDCTIRATEYANPNGEADDFRSGNWESDLPEPPAFASLASNILNDPNMRERLAAASPGLSQEYMAEMLKKLSGK